MPHISNIDPNQVVFHPLFSVHETEEIGNPSSKDSSHYPFTLMFSNSKIDGAMTINRYQVFTLLNIDDVLMGFAVSLCFD